MALPPQPYPHLPTAPQRQSHTVLLEIRDTIWSSVDLLSQLVHTDSSSSNHKPFLTYVNQTLTNMVEPQSQVVKDRITKLLHNPPDPEPPAPTQSRSVPPPQVMSLPFQGFPQALTYQGYGYQEVQEHRQQPFPVQAQSHRVTLLPPVPPMPPTPLMPPMTAMPPTPPMPPMPVLTQLQTRQPHDTAPSSTPQPSPASVHLSSVLGLTPHGMEEGALNIMGLSQLSESFLNTPSPVVLSEPGTPVVLQTSTPAPATSTAPGPFTPETGHTSE